MPIRFYVDASLIGVAEVLALLRDDVTFPGHVGCPPEITQRWANCDWVPLVAEQGWIAILRDFKLRSRAAERQAILDAGLGVIDLRSRSEISKFDHTRALMVHWDGVERLYAEEPRPFLFGLTRASGLYPLALG